jgi:diguanylate cyclase (GGDEF)-like protein/PAS domain S-box-containing protein
MPGPSNSPSKTHSNSQSKSNATKRGRTSRRVVGAALAASIGLGVGAGLTGFVLRHNERATSRWETAAKAHDALIEISTLEAIRAELASANEFDKPQLLQLWRQHESTVSKLLQSNDLSDLSPSAVENASRRLSIYSSAANQQVAFIDADPKLAQSIARDRVVPAFLDLQRALTDLRVELDRLGPDAQKSVDRDLWILLPALATLAALVCASAISSRRRAAIQAAEAARDAKFRAIVQGATDVLTVVDGNGKFSEVSESGVGLFGSWVPELVGADPRSFLDASDAAAFDEVAQSIAQTKRSRTLTVRVRHSDGRRRVVELTGSAPEALVGTAWVWHDVSAQTELAEQLRKQTFQDDLTGLANRALLRDRTTMALAEPTSVAMLLVDIDRFQDINDALGHEAGDEVLRAIAGRMRACVRPGDTVARLGGDEFAALVSGADTRSLEAVVERMLDSCRQPLIVNGQEVRATVSIGIAAAKRDGDVEDLLRRADTALAIAKSNGRDRSQVHIEEMDQRARQRVTLATELHHAVERDQLLAVYQPIVSLSDGTVSGFESLLRWRHPEHGLVSPVDFIPLAEENGTIIQIGRWILNTAVDQAALLPAPLRMNVNLSARQLDDPSLLGDVEAALARTGLDPSRLVLEITESLLLQDPEATIVLLQKFRDLGCLLAIDDFGTGYSSLGYLKRLPVNIVKLDKSFLDARLATSDGERAFLDSVLQIGRTLGLETVAEGIEDIGTSDTLRSIGCDKGQGYLFSKPVEAALVAEVAAKQFVTGNGATTRP